MIEPLAKGTYQAVAKEYSSNIFNGRWSFKLIVDIDKGPDESPYRIWHFVNAKWLPSILIAKMIGIITGDKFLASLTKEQVQRWTENQHMFGGKIDGNTIFMATIAVNNGFDGTLRNEIIDVTPKDVWVESNQVVLTNDTKPATEDDVPF